MEQVANGSGTGIASRVELVPVGVSVKESVDTEAAGSNVQLDCIRRRC